MPLLPTQEHCKFCEGMREGSIEETTKANNLQDIILIHRKNCLKSPDSPQFSKTTTTTHKLGHWLPLRFIQNLSKEGEESFSSVLVDLDQSECFERFA